MAFLDNLPDLGLGGSQRPRKAKPVVRADRDVVTWVKVYCPACGSGDCPVIDSRQKPLRKHRCRCGHEFWSNEKNYRAADGTEGP